MEFGQSDTMHARSHALLHSPWLQRIHQLPMNLRRTPFSIEQIFVWADAHHERTGQWPKKSSGLIPDMLGETWRRVDNALRHGLRGLPDGSSLAQLLDEHRGVRNPANLPALTVTEEQVLQWADAHYQQTGTWPTEDAGPIPQTRGEHWQNIAMALREGNRGRPGGSSLARLLEEHRGVRNQMNLPLLSEAQILAWADHYYQETGEWPQRNLGEVTAVPGETWRALDDCLRVGCRSLPGGSSLAQLLAKERGVRNKADLPSLKIKDILAWVDAYHQRTGGWPTGESGPVPEAPGETWKGIEMALFEGLRGLPGRRTIARLLRQHGRRQQRISLRHQLPTTSKPVNLSNEIAHPR
jgi:hypothetical protein